MPEMRRQALDHSVFDVRSAHRQWQLVKRDLRRFRWRFVVRLHATLLRLPLAFGLFRVPIRKISSRYRLHWSGRSAVFFAASAG